MADSSSLSDEEWKSSWGDDQVERWLYWDLRRFVVKKDRSNFENKTDRAKMLPELYRSHLKNQLNSRLLTTIEVLVWLIQVHKQVRIERLAAHFPLPIKFESRRRHIQRFLQLPQLSVVLLWFPIISAIIQSKIKLGKRIYLAIDRTQWQDKNLFVVAVIIEPIWDLD
jgi:hypothetical protein